MSSVRLWCPGSWRKIICPVLIKAFLWNIPECGFSYRSLRTPRLRIILRREKPKRVFWKRWTTCRICNRILRHVRVKVKVKVNLSLPQSCKHVGGRGIALFDLNLGTGWTGVVSLTLRMSFTRKITLILTQQDAVWALRRYGQFREESLSLAGIWCATVQPLASSIYRLRYQGSCKN